MSYQWSYGDILEAVEKITPEDQPALIHGDRVTNWGSFVHRTNNLARNLLASGVEPGEKIAFYMRNCPEYSEGIAAGFKAGLTHVNVNYRYIEQELIYLLDNSDATVVIYNSEFQHYVDEIKNQLLGVKLWLVVDDGRTSAYENMANNGDGSSPNIKHSPDDLLFLYTGGTTGMPKGVMWRHDDLFQVLGAGGNARLGTTPCADLAEFLERLKANPKTVNLPLPPLMHGTGLLSAVGAMAAGGTCITLTSQSFEPKLALENITKHKVTQVTIVGDAFARPMLEVLDENPEEYDISSVSVINSSGVMWTREIKAGLLKHNENLLLSDAFSSSEAIGIGTSLMTKDQTIDVAKFSLGPNCKVFSEDLIEVKPGTGESGMVAVRGFLPVGYYKDQEKTDKTFKIIDGVRYSIPGDWVRVEDDGSLTLLGRGSNCINTAGEKVYPEEVEEALKLHDTVADALVVGVKDAKWGQSITAVVQPNDGCMIDELELKKFSRKHLAAYKLPKQILVKGNLNRAPNGKADYKSIQEYAERQLGITKV
jgi:acyl-CoA synthetase (AMP-forming)/AMP-acid ligase II|tara:strand:+ start:3804 stop:5414 length:1611 start_codon:yes stop_codon:yes gene_type:complete